MLRSKIIMITIILVVGLLFLYSPLKKAFIGTEQTVETTYSYVDGELSVQDEVVSSNNTISGFWE